MRALTWQATNSVVVEDVPDPMIIYPSDAIIRVTSTAICGSDLHLLDVMGPFMHKHDVLGHEPMGVVIEIGSEVTKLRVGDRVVLPFVIACGHCYMCLRGLTSQCETTQNREQKSGATLYGYTELYGRVPGGQAEFLRVPLADFNAMKINTDLPDERYLFLSDILPTAWQAVNYAQTRGGEVLAVSGLGPVGQLAARIGVFLGYRVLAIEPVEERRTMARRHGVEAFDLTDDIVDELRDLTDGRGPDSVIDAVGMEAHGAPFSAAAQAAVGLLPKPLARATMQHVGIDRLTSMLNCFELVRRGGTVSLAGVYGGESDPLPVKSLFDKGVSIRMGQCNVKRWVGDLIPLVEDPRDPLSLADLVTHTRPLEDAPSMYEVFQKKEDGCIKVVLRP